MGNKWVGHAEDESQVSHLTKCSSRWFHFLSWATMENIHCRWNRFGVQRKPLFSLGHTEF